MFVDLVSVGVTQQRRQPAARRLGVEAEGSSGFVQHPSRALVVISLETHNNLMWCGPYTSNL